MAYDVTLRIEHVIAPWYWVSSLIGCAMIFCASMLITEHCPENVKNVILYVGKNSLIYYSFNDFILKILKGIFFSALGFDLSNAEVIVSFLVGVGFVIVASIIIWPVTEIIMRYFPWSVGKWKKVAK